MNSEQFYAYLHCRPDLKGIGSIFYVGKGKRKRAHNLSRRHNTYHSNIVNKFGKENISIKVLNCTSEEAAHSMEVSMISVLRRMGINLVNQTEGGEGSSGYIHSSESIEKIIRCQNNRTEKHKANLSASLKGKIPWNRGMIGCYSEETKQEISNSLKGNKLSEETKRKIGNASKGNQNLLGYVHTSEAKEKISSSLKEFYSKIPKSEILVKSKVENPTRLAWITFDSLFLENPEITRKEIMIVCVAKGISTGTAGTQYCLWKKKKANG